MSEAPRVTIAGGGLAGLTAALRLAERGYRVKLYEQKSWLGGNVGSRPAENGVPLDVYPHMYLDWYHNFWRLLGDATKRDRDELFVPLSTVKQLRRGEFPKFTGLTNLYSPWHVLHNLFSGVGPVADMVVFGYASIDLLAERCNPTMLRNDLSVGGFLNARPYMTERAANAVDSFITTVWSIPSSLTSAEDYQAYLEYCLADPTPALWLARGSAFNQMIGPLTAALEAAGVEIVPSVAVTSVSCRNGRVSKIGLQNARFDQRSSSWVGTGRRWAEEIDELILAVPPDVLSRLVRTGNPGRRVVDAVPEIAELSRMRTQQIPVLNLYFTRKWRHFPAEPVGLFDSPLALAFTDISQTWEDTPEFADRTVLAVSASDPDHLPGTGPRDDGMAMLREFAEYVDFEPGKAWGASPDIDWERTRYDPNRDSQLFVHETGTEAWLPAVAYDGLANLCFAGDFCRNRIGMTTVESAVTTGLEAARVVVERRGVGAPVEILEPRSSGAAMYVWLRYAWAPYAAAAKAWSSAGDGVRTVASRLSDARSLLGQLLTPGGPPRRHRRES